MKCPVRKRLKFPMDEEGNERFADCLTQECAWWDTEFEACSFKTFSHYIDRLARHLSDIRRNMPVWKQM